ncbi:MAG: DUF1573 domain-containing protein [Sphingobacteriales bacterium]|nr:MAG: DUF1573 domain-containing protein [Sphingobacteriales bacterium]
MKQIFSAFVALVFANIVLAQTKVADNVKFASEVVDLGNVKQGNPVTGSFTLTNIGKEALIIESVTPGCGCTKSDYTKEPIMPGKTGTITATYNAAVAGNFSKIVYIKFKGIDEQKNVSITGKVWAAAQYDSVMKAHSSIPVITPESKTTTGKVASSKTKKTTKTKTPAKS